jgi:hypothetical protein
MCHGSWQSPDEKRGVAGKKGRGVRLIVADFGRTAQIVYA